MAVRGWWPYLAIAFTSVVLRAIVPMDIVWGSGHDSQLQVVVARNIMSGQWLGFELFADSWIGSQWNLALAKGVGYPLFLVLVKPLGLTPVAAAQLLYLLGALMVARTLHSWVNGRFGVFVFGVLAFSPALYGGEFSRVYRNHLVAATALITLGLVLRCSNHVRQAFTAATTPKSTLGVRYFILVTLTGVVMSLSWLTRLDVHWIAITAGLAWLVVGWPSLLTRATLLRVVAPTLALLGAGFAVVPLAVATANFRQYDIFALDDYGSGPIAETQLLLSRIAAEPVHPLVHVSAEQRAKAYAVSPTLASVAAQLEDPESGWKSNPSNTGEAAGWFSWELRDAPVRAGKVATLRELHDFFAAVEHELSLACESNRLDCSGVGEFAPGVRFITQVDKASFVDEYVRAMMVHLEGAGAANFFNITPLGIPELDTLWTTTVNGIDTVRSPTQVTQPAELTSRLYFMATVVALLLLFAAVILRRPASRTLLLFALACVLGTLLNAFIVTWFSLEIGVTTRDNAGYLFASQSYLYVALLLAIGAFLQPHFGSPQRLRGVDIPESA